MMLKKHILFLLLSGILASAAMAQTQVVINQKHLSPKELLRLKSQVGRVAPGNYWYDAKSGAWGYQGGPTVGFIPAKIPVGGKLRSNASNGIDGVYVNGRSLHRGEVLALKNLLGVVYQGRYWMDALGNYGIENGMWLGNLYLIANQVAQRGGGNRGGNGSGGNSFWHSGATDNTVSSNSNGDFYIMGDGFSYSSFD